MTQTEIIRNLESLQKNVNKGTLQISNRQKKGTNGSNTTNEGKRKSPASVFHLKKLVI